MTEETERTRMRSRGRIVIAAMAMIVGVLAAAPSQGTIIWNLKPAGTGDYDWTLRGMRMWYESRPGNGLPWAAEVGGFKWDNAAAGWCFEISTAPGKFTSNPDTRIWVAEKTHTTWYPLSDNYNGTLQSRARIWVGFPVGQLGVHYVAIAPKTSAGIYDDFEVVYTRRDLTEAACTTGQSLPWAKFKGPDYNNFTLTRSSNAN